MIHLFSRIIFTLVQKKNKIISKRLVLGIGKLNVGALRAAIRGTVNDTQDSK